MNRDFVSPGTLVRRRWVDFVVAALLTVSTGCGAQGSTATDDVESALATDGTDGTATSTDADAERRAQASTCLTAFASCVREGDDTDACHETLHECMRPPHPPHPPADAAPPPPPNDAGPPPPHPHRHPPAGDADCPDGGPHGERNGEPGPHGRAGGPPPDGGGGPQACIDALVTCSEGDTDLDACVAAAVACLDALPRPPHPPPPPPHS